MNPHLAEQISKGYLEATVILSKVVFSGRLHTESEIVNALAGYWTYSLLAKRCGTDTSEADGIVIEAERNMIKAGIIRSEMKEAVQASIRRTIRSVVTRGSGVHRK